MPVTFINPNAAADAQAKIQASDAGLIGAFIVYPRNHSETWLQVGEVLSMDESHFEVRLVPTHKFEPIATISRLTPIYAAVSDEDNAQATKKSLENMLETEVKRHAAAMCAIRSWYLK